jgi:hypothetical protein
MQIGFGAGQASQRLPTETHSTELGCGWVWAASCDQAGIALAKGKCEKEHPFILIGAFLFLLLVLHLYLMRSVVEQILRLREKVYLRSHFWL